MQRQKASLHLPRCVVAGVVAEGTIPYHQREEKVIRPPQIFKESEERVTSPTWWSDRWVAAEHDDI